MRLYNLPRSRAYSPVKECTLPFWRCLATNESISRRVTMQISRQRPRNVVIEVLCARYNAPNIFEIMHLVIMLRTADSISSHNSCRLHLEEKEIFHGQSTRCLTYLNAYVTFHTLEAVLWAYEALIRF